MIIVLFLLVFITGAQGVALPAPQVPAGTVLLSAQNSRTFPRHFRTTHDQIPADYEKAGLCSLNMSGSGQFSTSQLIVLLDRLKQFGIVPAQVVIVDLRKEPHAFINGDAIRWYMQDAWWTTNISAIQVLDDEKQRLEDIGLGQDISINSIVKKNKAGQIAHLVTEIYKVSSLMTEPEVVFATGASYVRIPVTDHMRPSDQDVDQFLELVQKLPPWAWVHFHCHAGRGRTSTFMILYDMIRNPKLPLDAIIDRQVYLGSLDIRKLSHGPKAHKNANEKERYAFIKDFYEYLNAPDGYGVNSWTAWVTNRRNDLNSPS